MKLFKWNRNKKFQNIRKIGSQERAKKKKSMSQCKKLSLPEVSKLKEKAKVITPSDVGFQYMQGKHLYTFKM